MGKFYEMLNDFHDSSKKWDPLTHYTLDLTHDASTKSVGETSHLIGNLFGDTALGNAGKHWDQMADKDKADFGRWAGNTIGSAAAIYGGMSAYGAGAGAGSGSGAGAGAGWVEGPGGMYTLAGEGGGTTAATGLAEPAAGGAGGLNWSKLISGGLRGSGNSMQQGASSRQSSYDRRTAEILAEIMREKEASKQPGWVNPNMPQGATATV